MLNYHFLGLQVPVETQVFKREVLITSIFLKPLKTYCNNVTMMNIQMGASQDFPRHQGQKCLKHCSAHICI